MHHIAIKIEYKLINSSEWQSIDFLPDEYFDLDPDENVEWDCVSFYNHGVDYLDIDHGLVQYTKITIVDTKADIVNVITETFWNHGKNRITENSISGSTVWWETIIEIQLKNNPTTYEILRYTKENNIPKLSYHGLIQDNEDGSQEERKIYSN